MKRDDLLWKAILEEIFEDFLRFFYANADDLFDMERGFEYLDKELEQLFPPEDGHYAPRFVDKLVKVFRKDGSENWLLVHIEVQGQYSKDFGERMFTYYYRIKDKYDTPITAFAIFTDKNRKFHPKKFEREYLGTRVSYEFNTYKIIEQNEEILAQNPNPFSLVVLVVLTALKVREMNDEVLLGLKRDLLRIMLQYKLSKKKRHGIFSFLKYYVDFKNPEMMLIFEKDVEHLTGRSKIVGVEEYLKERFKREGLQEGEKKGLKLGKIEGKAEGEREKAIAIAREFKKMGLSLADISKGTGLSIEEVEKL